MKQHVICPRLQLFDDALVSRTASFVCGSLNCYTWENAQQLTASGLLTRTAERTRVVGSDQISLVSEPPSYKAKICLIISNKCQPHTGGRWLKSQYSCCLRGRGKTVLVSYTGLNSQILQFVSVHVAPGPTEPYALHMERTAVLNCKGDSGSTHDYTHSHCSIQYRPD